MFYAILGIIVVVALFLIFRDDHDDSYNKSEKGQWKAQQTRSFSHTQGQSQPKQQAQYRKDPGPGPKAEPKAERKTSGPSLKEQILGQIEEAITEAKKNAEEPMKMFGEALNMAKEAVKEAQKGWNTSGTQTDVDEQSQEDDLDLSFLDGVDFDEDLDENTETFDILRLGVKKSVKLERLQK